LALKDLEALIPSKINSANQTSENFGENERTDCSSAAFSELTTPIDREFSAEFQR
jgi:hypothetical protein